MTQIAEIMNRRVISVDPKLTLSSAVKLFTENHVGGAPVVDGQGHVLGMISELQLLDVVFDLKARDAPVSDYMTVNFQSVGPHDTLARAAQLFALFSFRRLPVVDAGRLVGIVTRRDLMNHALRTGERLTEPLVELIPDLELIT